MKAIQVLVLACVLATDIVQAQMQDGWSAQSIVTETEDCTTRLAAGARDGFARKADSSPGVNTAFPESQVRDSIAPMCGCVVTRASATWPLAEWRTNSQDRLDSMFQDAMSGGPCKPVTGMFAQMAKEMEGGTSRLMQEDFDRIRLDHALVIGALLDEYRAKAGVYPFADGTDSVPAVVLIGSPRQLEQHKDFRDTRIDFDLRATNGAPAPRASRVTSRTMSEFEDELRRVLGRAVQVPVDPQQVPLNKPSIYTYVLYQDIYDVSVFLHQEFPFARPLGPHYNKVAVASRSYPRRGFWSSEDLKKNPQFIEFFQRPFNRERYTLKTRL